MAITTHWAPKTSASSLTSSGRATAAELTEILSAPASRTAWASSADRIPPPIVNGMNTWSAARRASSTTVPRLSDVAGMSRKTSSAAPAASYRSASSTGSPASRMSTKFVPLTTRPASTSRQGITRLRCTSVTVAERPQEAVELGEVQLAARPRLERAQPVVALRARDLRGDALGLAEALHVGDPGAEHAERLEVPPAAALAPFAPEGLGIGADLVGEA